MFFLKRCPCICFVFCFLFLNWISATNNLQKFDSISQYISTKCVVSLSKSQHLLGELKAIINENPDNINLIAQALDLEALINFNHGISDIHFDEKIRAIEEQWDIEKYPYEKALLEHALLMQHISNENYTKALESALKALEQFQVLEDTIYTVKTMSLLAHVFYLTGSNDMATEYYHKSLALAPPGQKEYYLAYLNLYVSKIFSSGGKDTKSPMDSLIAVIPLVEAYGDTTILVSLYSSLGTSCFLQGEFDRGKENHLKSRYYVEQMNMDNNVWKFHFLYNYGSLEYYSENFESALQYYNDAKLVAEKNKNLKQLSFVLQSMASLYKTIGMQDSSYSCLEQYHNISRKLRENSRIIEAYQQYTSVFLESVQKELTITQQEVLLKNRLFTITILIIVGIIIIIFAFVAIFQQKKRQQALLKEAENKELARQLSQEKKIKRLQKEKIESQVRELSSNTLLLSSKNEVLTQIHNLVKKLPDDCKEVGEIEQIVKNNLSTDQAWDNFKVHFEQVHPQFFDKLKAQCKDLTEGNLRHCAYLRIGMTSKQISQIQNVLPENVRKSTYRLKKKLGLNEEEDFYDFLRNL